MSATLRSPTLIRNLGAVVMGIQLKSEDSLMRKSI